MCVCVMFCMLASEYQPDRNRLIRCTFVRFSSLWHQSNYLHMCKELDSGYDFNKSEDCGGKMVKNCRTFGHQE